MKPSGNGLRSSARQMPSGSKVDQKIRYLFNIWMKFTPRQTGRWSISGEPSMTRELSLMRAFRHAETLKRLSDYYENCWDIRA